MNIYFYDLLTDSNVNTAGLVFDLIGVICVAVSFKNIRREKEPDGFGFASSNYESEKRGKDEEHRSLIKIDRLGMAFLVAGFVLQIISNYIA